MGVMPLRTRTFYKYKSCADEGGTFDRVMDSIRGKYLYITRAIDLNDPMEAVLLNDCDATDEEIRGWLRRKGRSTDAKNVERMKLSELKELMIRQVQHDKEHTHIFSLTKDGNNKKMWNKYADGERGICLGYRAFANPNSIIDEYAIEVCEENLPLIEPYLPKEYCSCAKGMTWVALIPVSYDKIECPQYNIFTLLTDEKRKEMKKSFMSKTKDWEYEQEVRIVVLDRNMNDIDSPELDVKMHYPDATLCEVCFGRKMDEGKKKTIMECLRKEYINFNDIVIH